MEWKEYYLNLCEHIKLKSKDQHTKIGVIIVGSGNAIVSTGYNSFPRGIDDTVPDRQLRPEKYFWFEHAERNAIYNAARLGVSTLGCTMYMSCGVPCTDCARGIINSGIIKIIVGNNDTAKGGKYTQADYDRSLQLFAEAGVEVEYT